jgi:hypothetical protein
MIWFFESTFRGLSKNSRRILNSVAVSLISVSPRHTSWLGDVVVSTDAQASDPVGDGGLRGEKQHRNIGTVGTDATRYLQSADVRKHHVEDEEVERLLREERERFIAAEGDSDVVAVVAESHRH